MRSKFIIFLAIVPLFFVACSGEEPPAEQDTAAEVPVTKAVGQGGCKQCHEGVALDRSHDLLCTSCHSGDMLGATKSVAHAGLVAKPAHPDTMQSACGQCHPEQLESASHSQHFKLQNKVNQVRVHFGAQKQLPSMLDIPVGGNLTSPISLVDDMLRRRCLRCHVYSSGDEYVYVSRGTGCAACHMQFLDGKLQSHALHSPEDTQCLSCHYGNYVGGDYYGQYEHDYNWEYRTPYTTSAPYLRPYGVEHHDLVPDVHQQRGLTCADCHSASGHQDIGTLTCKSCHGWQPGTGLPGLANLAEENGRLVLQSRAGDKKHEVPLLNHPAHKRYGNKVACQVCHGQWAFNDRATHLLLSPGDDYDMWERLTVQSSSEVEQLLEHNLYSDEEELDAAMRDGITGELRPGVWYKGYTQRRWEDILVGKDQDGIIKVFRPILDLHLSAVNDKEEVLFDNLRGGDPGLRAYTPHTTGRAGLYYLDRFRHLLEQ